MSADAHEAAEIKDSLDTVMGYLQIGGAVSDALAKIEELTAENERLRHWFRAWNPNDGHHDQWKEWHRLARLFGYSAADMEAYKDTGRWPRRCHSFNSRPPDAAVQEPAPDREGANRD